MDKKKSLKNSIIDGAAYSAMTGFGNSYINPFAIALGASNTAISLLSSLPELFKALFQLVSVQLTDTIKQRKKIILAAALIHAIMWIPLFILPFAIDSFSTPLLILVVIISFIADGFGAPPWISWIGDLVPEDKRGKFFGLRNRIMGFTSFVSVIGAGFILEYFSPQWEMLGYFVVFSLAFLFRFISFLFLRKMHEPVYEVEKKHTFSFFDFVKRMRNTNFGTFVLYITLFRFGVSIASPFFVVFIFRDLNMSYASYTILSAAQTITTFIMVAYWGKHGDRYGNKAIFTLTGLLMPLVPGLWLFSQNFYYLLFAYVFAGFVWAGFNLTTTNFIFDNVSPEKRARCSAYYNVFAGAANFLGAITGGLLLNILPATSFFVSNIQFLFLISAILRLLPGLIFFPRIEETRETEKIKKVRLLFNVAALEPMQFLTYQSSLGMKRVRKVGKKQIARGKSALDNLLSVFRKK